jgi:hypothetical protein
MNEHYVYVYLDPRKPGKYKYETYKFDHEPFYVGRGKGERWRFFQHARQGDSTTHKYHKIHSILSEKMEPIIHFLKVALTFDESEEIEKYFIHVLGRLDLGTGSLVNHTDGGGGVPGFTMPQKSEHTLEKMATAQRGKKYSEEVNKKKGVGWLGRKHTQEEKDKIARANRGKVFSDEHKVRISKSKTGARLNLSNEERERRQDSMSKPLPIEHKLKGMRTRIQNDISKMLDKGIKITESAFNAHKTRQTCRYSSVLSYYTKDELNHLIHG